jgi:hypothetical protein
MPDRHCHTWEPIEIAALEVSFAHQHHSIPRLAIHHKRTTGGISSQLDKMGLIENPYRRRYQ